MTSDTIPAENADGKNNGLSEDTVATKEGTESQEKNESKVDDQPKEEPEKETAIQSDSQEKKPDVKGDQKIAFKPLTEEEQKTLLLRVEKLETYLNKDIKELCQRTDISAFNKVVVISNIIKNEFDPPEVKKAPEEEVKVGEKRAAPEEADEKPKPKISKPDGEDGEKEKGMSDDEEIIDSCVVCGLYLNVFKEDQTKEMHHYLSHGFNILKEFSILKPDDTLFLVCNLCGSPFPKKCHGNFRKHLILTHQEKIVEIFRDI